MLDMAKKRPKKPAGRARDRGETRLVTFELDVKLDDALEVFHQRDRRTKKAIVSMALEQFLERQGAWPPDSEE